LNGFASIAYRHSAAPFSRASSQPAHQRLNTTAMSATQADATDAGPFPWWKRLHFALMPDYNRKAAWYWWTMVALGAGALAAAAWNVAWLPYPALLQVVVGCLVAMLAGIYPVRVPGAKNSFAAGEIFIFLLLLMHGPAAAALAAAGEAFVGSARTSKRWTSRLASPAMAAIAMLVMGWALQISFDSLHRLGAYNEAALLIGTMGFAIGYFLLNTLLVTLVIHLKRNEPLRLRDFFGNFGWVGITYAASALIAALLSLASQSFGIAVVGAAIPIIAMLLTMLHYHFRQRETDDTAARVRIEAAEREAAQSAKHVIELQDSERRFHSAFSHAAIGMALVSTEGQVLQVNTAMCGLLGHAEADVVGREFNAFLDVADVALLDEQLQRVVRQETEAVSVELRCRHAQGHEVWISLHCGFFSGRTSSAPCLILQAQDITARRDAEARLHHMAYHDSLTSLVNRVRFGHSLAQAVERCNKDRRRNFALMYLDFDRFKLINDTLGHGVGDEFLVTVAQRILKQVRPGDTVGRLGGDEFAILVEDLEGEHLAVAMAERLQVALRKPYLVGGTEVNSSASIGITFSSIGYDTPGDVLRDADIAMYRAKAGGRARYAVFDASLRAHIADQLHLERDLRRAIEGDELFLAYQPIYDLGSGKINSFEALLRWNHPERGLVGPDVFIPIAEESGLIGTLTELVLTRACRQLKAWQTVAETASKLRMQVNVSGTDLCRLALVSHVTRALLTNGLEPWQLTLEITESMLMKRLDSALETMTQLRELGVGLSVDDFGTGYSSLSYLSTLPITSLKIDRSFVQRLQDGTRNSEVVKAIVTLGHSLGRAVIAEGIESPAQLSKLRELGCGFGQGYLLARPLSAEMAEAWLADERTAVDAEAGLRSQLGDSEFSNITVH
jgi:diguanylate cyclase (GGDEF)-like protein/PAS domain S-box-containing protein